MSLKMIKQEQKELADYVKGVHLSLRRKSQQIGAEAAWKEHLESEDILRKYAFCMRKLAEDFWSVNNENNDNSVLCRIKWMVKCILDYYQNREIQKEIEKENKKLETYCQKKLIELKELECLQTQYIDEFPWTVLDVGSCYNPFKKFEFLKVYPIDLYPASPDVKKCNFLELEVKSNLNKNWFQDNLLEIPSQFFDVVVFSLFLEYLPSPKQRYLAFVKAYETLKTNGILLIATPDSKHASANSQLMKNWKIAASKIGFVRIKLEKLRYLYCMCFRKCASRKYPLILNNIEENLCAEEMLCIPQDTVEYDLIEKTNERFDDAEVVKELFSELPLC